MSLSLKILSLLSDIKDPLLRVDISAAIHYIFSLFSMGSIDEGKARHNLKELCYDVIRFKKPELTEEEARKQVEEIVDDLIRTFKLESARKRMFSTLGRQT